MKYTFTSLLVMLVFVGLTAFRPVVKDGEKATIRWDKTEMDFGQIPQGTPVTAEFTFTNTGKVPVVINNVITPCGCTQPQWSKEPVMPGKKGKVSAVYNAAAPGTFGKTLTVEVNTEAAKEFLTIKGEVVAKAQ